MTKDEEAEANAFAMELLIPEEWLRRDVAEMTGGRGIDFESDPVIAKLAKRYGVSEQLMTIRIVRLTAR